jgi:hypothetical protein
MPHRHGCLGCFGGCLTKSVLLLVLGAACFGLIVAVLNPWALHIGGGSTPFLYWQGTGTLVTKDGKSDPFYLFLYPGSSMSRLHKNGEQPVSGLSGTAQICTAPGESQVLKVSGTMWGSRSSTDGDLVSLRVLEWKLIDTANRKGYFDLIGAWHGSALVLDQPDAETRTFLNGLRIDGPKVTLRAGSKDDFEAACHALTSTPIPSH